MHVLSHPPCLALQPTFLTPLLRTHTLSLSSLALPAHLYHCTHGHVQTVIRRIVDPRHRRPIPRLQTPLRRHLRASCLEWGRGWRTWALWVNAAAHRAKKEGRSHRHTKAAPATDTCAAVRDAVAAMPTGSISAIVSSIGRGINRPAAPQVPSPTVPRRPPSPPTAPCAANAGRRRCRARSISKLYQWFGPNQWFGSKFGPNPKLQTSGML